MYFSTGIYKIKTGVSFSNEDFINLQPSELFEMMWFLLVLLLMNKDNVKQWHSISHNIIKEYFISLTLWFMDKKFNISQICSFMVISGIKCCIKIVQTHFLDWLKDIMSSFIFKSFYYCQIYCFCHLERCGIISCRGLINKFGMDNGLKRVNR